MRAVGSSRLAQEHAMKVNSFASMFDVTSTLLRILDDNKSFSSTILHGRCFPVRKHGTTATAQNFFALDDLLTVHHISSHSIFRSRHCSLGSSHLFLLGAEERQGGDRASRIGGEWRKKHWHASHFYLRTSSMCESDAKANSFSWS